MSKIIIFGTGKIAEVIYYYFSRCAEIQVCGFTINQEYRKKIAWSDLPVVDFESIENHFPPDEYIMFVALGYQDMNQLRADRCAEAKNKGYKLFTFIDPKSNVPDDFQYGENCFVMTNQNIQPRVSIGNNVFIWSGVTIGHHTQIDDNCWLTSAANIAGNVVIGKNCFIGINATLVDSITIDEYCLLGASTLISKSLPKESVVMNRDTELSRLNSKQFLTLSSRMRGQ